MDILAYFTGVLIGVPFAIVIMCAILIKCLWKELTEK